MNEDRPNLTSAIAIVTVLAISIGSIGALIAARHIRLSGAVISGPRLTSPSPSAAASPPADLPSSAQVVAPSTGVVWVLIDYDALFRSTDQGNTWEKRSLPAPPGGIRPTVQWEMIKNSWP